MNASSVVLAILTILGLFVLALIVVALTRWARRSTVVSVKAAPTVLSVGVTGVATVVLEIDAADPSSPVVERLVHETATRVFAMVPDAEEVEVLSRTGAVVGRVSRKASPSPATSISSVLHEPHARRPRGPDLSGHLMEEELSLRHIPRVGTAPAPTSPPPTPPHRPMVDRFDLPETVRVELRDPDDPLDLVRAILKTAGIHHEVEGDLIRAGDLAVMVMRPRGGVVVGHDALNHAYLRLVRSGAQRGLVIAIGLVDPREITRREMLAPQILHTGPDAIQRMADAVALGADPLRFATGIPMIASS